MFYAGTSAIHGPGHIEIYSSCGVERFTYHYYPNSGGSVIGAVWRMAARVVTLAAMRAYSTCLAGLAIASACAQTTPPAERVPIGAADHAPDASNVVRIFAPTDAARLATTAGSAGVADEDEVAATFRSCTADSDCVSVDRVGCCHNGWKVAVASLQREAYLRSFACPDPHPICAMYIVRDQRVPRCDQGTKLCALIHP
ncbi:MAG: hypothetical protein M3O50_13865 [Myxococcota bacterium]|nr:hypothetical protein [Myxococcota bacterium]